MSVPKTFRQMEAYWEGLRPNGDIPNRDDISPRGFEDGLDFAFLLEVSQSGETVFRLTGERLADLLGVSLDRVPMTALFSRTCQTQIRNAMLSVFASPGILRAEILSEAGIARPELPAQLLVMPLRNKDKTVSCAMGMLHFEGPVGKTPRQFTNFSYNLTRVVMDEPNSMLPSLEKTLGLAEPDTAFQHKERRPAFAGRPNFKIIDGGLS